MFTAFVLVVLVVACRFASLEWHEWNFVPIGAVALFAGSRLPRRWAWLVPVAGMVLSDLVLDYYSPRPFFELTRWTVFATLAVTSLLGPMTNLRKIGPWLVPVLALGGSMLFFLTTNLATWAEGRLYPLTFAGLVACYTAGIPFFWNTLLSDFIGVAVLFTVAPVLERVRDRMVHNRPAGALEPIPVTSESREG
jgi:hypothetical protein